MNINVTNWDRYAKYLKVNNKPWDEGIDCIWELHIWRPWDGKEVVIGEWDSTTEWMVVYHYDWVTYTDVTDKLTDLDWETTWLFGWTTAWLELYVGSDFTYWWVKVNIDTLWTVEPANVVGEYWDWSAWQISLYMASDANFPYEQRGYNIASCCSKSEQWRFWLNPYTRTVVWGKSTINWIEKYWWRFRITSDITTDPIIEQIKLHTNRYECNWDWTTEYFGKSRYIKTLKEWLQATIQNLSRNPPNQAVSYWISAKAWYSNNKFANNANDWFIIVENIVDWLDTSIPLIAEISYYVWGTATGNIEIKFDKYSIADWFVYDGTATPTTTRAVDTISSSQDEVRRTITTLIPVNNLTTNDAIVLDIHRDATVWNTNDTLEWDIVITNIRLRGYFRRP